KIEMQDFFYQGIEIECGEYGRRCFRIIAEVIDHALHCSNLIDNGFSAALKHASIIIFELVSQLHVQALCRKLYRCERILDFVCQTTGDFTPCNRTLCRDNVGNIIEYHHISSLAYGRKA